MTAAFSLFLIKNRRVFLDSANAIAASTFGFIEPSANSPADTYSLACVTVISSSHFSFTLPKLMATFSTAVRITRTSASISWANKLLVQSLSITAAAP